ncbi:MAG: DUF1653 domain-containing protein [Lachnospiraceae bacterium]
MSIINNQIYKHFKGNLYKVLMTALDSETLEEMVVYQALYGEYKIFVRSKKMFEEVLDKTTYPDATQKFRFELVESLINVAEIQTEQVQNREEKKEAELHPLVEQFLDASTYEERLNILVGLEHIMTQDIIQICSTVLDLELKEGTLEEQFLELKHCLKTLEKFECNRLR